MTSTVDVWQSVTAVKNGYSLIRLTGSMTWYLTPSLGHHERRDLNFICVVLVIDMSNHNEKINFRVLAKSPPFALDFLDVIIFRTNQAKNSGKSWKKALHTEFDNHVSKHQFFSCGHWYLCFALLMMSAVAFEARVYTSLACFVTCMQ